MARTSPDEMRSWATVVAAAGYPGELFLEYLMDEFRISLDEAEDVAAGTERPAGRILVPISGRSLT